ncbi:MAG: ATP-binding cassette domain-containing protein, partial [Acidovorax sp.]
MNAARASVAAPDHPPVFSLQGVGVRYGRVQALHGVNLSVAPGERVALIGANGCGKSTLLRVLHGLVKPSSGQLLRGDGLRQAMLFQRPYMLRASALYNVALGLWLHGMRWREARALALAALQRVGLQGIAAQSARTLSGGQQQRVALARAWALRPDVLLLDEPTASLDPHAKREVELLMADLGGCRTWSVDSENRRFRQNGPQRGQFLPDLQPYSPAMGQKDTVLEERQSQKWTAAADLQPT